MTDKQPIAEDEKRNLGKKQYWDIQKVDTDIFQVITRQQHDYHKCHAIIDLILDGQNALEELPKYVKALAETNTLYENRKLEVSYLTEENQHLKAEIQLYELIQMQRDSLQREIEELKRQLQK